MPTTRAALPTTAEIHDAILAYDEDLRQRMIEAAYLKLADNFANSDLIWSQWKTLFDSFDESSNVPGIPHAKTFYKTQVAEAVV